MKPACIPVLLLLLAASICALPQIPFGKKIQPPAVRGKDEAMIHSYSQKEHQYPYTYDVTTKRFVMSNADRSVTSYPAHSSMPSGKSGSVKQPGNDSYTFSLTKDINDLAESFPGNSPNNAHYSFAVLNDVSYFYCNDGVHGREPWRSDGTAAGTYLLKDINTGEAGSGDGNMIAVNGLIYFTAFTNENGTEPWVSDGTPEGTRLLKDLVPGIGNSFATQFANVNGITFFTASQYGYNEQLWKTDGTDAGTMLVKDLLQSGMGYQIYELSGANHLAFFIAYTWNSGYQLLRSDGTESGTFVTKDIGYNFGEFNAPTQLTAFNNRLYFSANDGTGRKLWTSDGTYDGTRAVPAQQGMLLQADYVTIYNNHPFTIMNNMLYLAGYTESGGGGLFRYDGDEMNGIQLVKDLTDQPDYTYDSVFVFVVPVDITVGENQIFFKVISSINGWHDEIWKSSGEPGETELIRTIGQGQPGVYSYNFYTADGILYFVVQNDPLHGNELWKSNGTNAGTYLVKDILPGKSGSYPDDLTYTNGKLLFRATTLAAGNELWSSDGTEAGTTLVKDINTSSTLGSNAGFQYKGIGIIEDGVLFNAYTPALGAELYKSDGSAAGTKLLNDIAPGTEWSYPNYYIYRNNVTYFIGDNAEGTAIYSTNGTTAGLKRVTSYIDRASYYVVNYNVLPNGIVIYTLGRRDTGALELWRSNGAAAGTYMLTANVSYYYQNYVESIGKIAFFIAGDFNTGYELWKTDGTLPNTKMVKDINPGPAGSDPYSLFVYKNQLYFGAYDGASVGFHKSLWKTDGTEKGTVKVKNIEPGYYSPYFNTQPQQVFCESNGTLFFTAIDFNTYGNELWKTDGTEKSTTIVKNIHPYDGSYPANLTDVNGRLFFTATDDIHGTELWSTRGEEKNTAMVKDMTPGFGSSYLQSFCSAGGKLFFLNTGSPDSRLWSSDGTDINTKEVIDDVLDGLSDISQLTASGDKLFFGAYTLQYGTELYAGNASTSSFYPVTMKSSDELREIPARFQAILYPNPSKEKTLLQLDGDLKNTTVVITEVSGRMIWMKDVKSEKRIALPVEGLPAGIYFVNIKSDAGTKSLRFIKE